jgi:indole-3-glycerol phosphate synthase
MAESATADLLRTIVAATRRIVEVRQARTPVERLQSQIGARGGPGRLERALEGRDGVKVIAECKRRSPSRGVLRQAYDPAGLARGYAAAGAAAVSVLTEPTFFDGSLDHLAAVRAAVEVPLLRKDFIVSEYQLLEARVAGADAVLLIVAALEGGELAALLARTSELALDAVVEVHDRDELCRALDAGARIVGVNNRNLRTLEVDLRTSETLMPLMAGRVRAVSESGLRTAEDLLRLRGLGYDAFLVGERLMVEADPGRALQALLDGCAAAGRAPGSRRGAP